MVRVQVMLMYVSVVSVSGEVMSQSLRLRRDSILRWRQAATPTAPTAHCCCCVQRRVVMWVRCNIIVLATTAWLESLCRRGRVVVVVDCSAVECDYCSSQWPTRDLHCLMTSDEATRRPCMNVEFYHGRLLHSPTHTVTHTSVAIWRTEMNYLICNSIYFTFSSTSFNVLSYFT